MKKDKKLSAAELEKKFDDGEEVLSSFEQNKDFKKVLVDFPVTMLKEIDAEADRLGVARQAIIKMWLDEKLQIVKKRDKAG